MSERSRRRALLAGVLLVALVAGVAVLLGRDDVGGRRVVDRPRVSEEAPAPAADAVPAPGPATADAAVAPSTPPAIEPASPHAPKLPDSLGHAAADEYRRRARYPRSSQPVAEDEDPVRRDRQVSPVSSRGKDGAEPTLTVFPAKAGFEAPEPVVLYAVLTVNGTPVPAREIHGTLTDERLAPIADVVYHDDGAGGDQAAGDNVYTVALEPKAGEDQPLAHSYMVQVEATTTRDEPRRAASGFLYSSPHAQLTGRYRDALVDGSLVVDAEVQVTQGGRFHLEATLAGPSGGTMIAWAQSAAALDPGTHWMPLSFYGLVLRERGVDGPYMLRSVALSTTTQMPNGKNNLVENAYTTGAYQATAFTDKPFDDPGLLEAAARVERDGGTIDVAPLR